MTHETHPAPEAEGDEPFDDVTGTVDEFPVDEYRLSTYTPDIGGDVS